MKTFTQYGTFSIVFLASAIIICITLLLAIGPDEALPMAAVGIVVLTMVICLLIFYKLTITVDDSHLAFSLGIGLIRKKYLLSDIESCTPVRNSAFWGIGIRLIPSGWLYNVSGLDAVEVTFRNSRTRIRIGTNLPEEVSREVNSRLTPGTSVSAPVPDHKHGVFLPVALIITAIVVIFAIVVTGKRETEISFADRMFTISGMYGMSVNYNDIISADTLGVMPGIKTRTNGFAAGGVLKGHFKLDDNSKVMLYLVKGVPPFILIKTNNVTIYINFDNPAKTREVFNRITRGISSKK